ncbi:MAG: helix-turn-helix transcriptional regulator [Saprospiraceae bacterium]|nr:helix-turn-helix transcriptional regulator [Saprospiraceae bacterium]
MISREELLKSKEFWLVKLQAALFEQVELYLKENNISKTEFANRLGVSKGYVSQLLNGDFDHKMSKLIELSLAIGKAPILEFEDIDKCI